MRTSFLLLSFSANNTNSGFIFAEMQEVVAHPLNHVCDALLKFDVSKGEG